MADKLPQVSPAALPPSPRRPELRAEDIEPHRRDPKKDAREFPAYPPKAHPLAQRQNVPSPVAFGKLDPRAAKVAQRSAWWEDPIALGSLLILLPPVGLAAVWMSKRYSSDARWALTVVTALMMCLMSAVTIAALVIR